MHRLLGAAVLSLVAVPAAGDLRLALPVDCALGDSCFIQHLVDRDPGPEVQDFTCGTLSYDGHKGTDFALPTLNAMHAGVDVLAAAPGVVRGLRDEMPDQIYAPDDPKVAGRECGNGVVIDHGDGWETQYCHLKRGSIRVAPGQQVDTGAVLGQIGLSGKTQFPHLHLSLRHEGAVVDPFLGDGPCGTADTLWESDLAVPPGGLIYAGFSPAVPTYDAVKQGDAAQAALPADAPALVLFVFAYGGQMGDLLTLRIDGPHGPVLTEEMVLDKHQAQFFRATGRRARGPWPIGDYTGTVTLTRDGMQLGQMPTQVTIK